MKINIFVSTYLGILKCCYCLKLFSKKRRRKRALNLCIVIFFVLNNIKINMDWYLKIVLRAIFSPKANYLNLMLKCCNQTGCLFSWNK